MADPFAFAQNDVLVIGLGGHKCGSTWLYEYLRDHPQCFAPLVKELAYFQDEDDDQWEWRSKGRLTRAMGEIEKYQSDRGEGEAQQEKRAALDNILYDLSANVASLSRKGPYALNFLRRQKGETHLVDITPRYAHLSEASLERILGMHHDVRFLFAMRDPAERVFSAFRYAYKRRGKGVAPRERVRLQQIEEYLFKNPFADEQTDYPSILDKIERVIGAERAHCFFYENLFCDETIEGICAFLGLAFVPGRYERRVHPTQSLDKTPQMSNIEREFLVDRYRYVYKEIKSRFGDDAPQNWNWPEVGQAQ